MLTDARCCDAMPVSRIPAWSALETSKTALEASRKEETALQAAAQWGAFQAAWGTVEAALAAADALVPLRQEGEAKAAASAALAQALAVANARLDALGNAEGGAEIPRDGAADALDLDAISGMGTLMQRQLQGLADWARRSEELSAQVQAAARTAPRISSFAQAQAEAAAALAKDDASAAGPELAALKASRFASGVLSKLSGVVVLRQQEEPEHRDESGVRTPATRVTLCLSTQFGTPAASAAPVASADDMYESEEAFARALEAQQQAQQGDSDLLVLSLLVLTSAQAKASPSSDPAAAAARTTPAAALASGGSSTSDELAGCVLLAGSALGSLSASALATIQNATAQRGCSDAAPAELERLVRPCRPGVSAAVARAVEQTLESQKLLHVRGVEALLRDLAWELPQ